MNDTSQLKNVAEARRFGFRLLARFQGLNVLDIDFDKEGIAGREFKVPNKERNAFLRHEFVAKVIHSARVNKRTHFDLGRVLDNLLSNDGKLGGCVVGASQGKSHFFLLLQVRKHIRLVVLEDLDQLVDRATNLERFDSPFAVVELGHQPIVIRNKFLYHRIVWRIPCIV